jgi:hypothetical protein
MRLFLLKSALLSSESQSSPREFEFKTVNGKNAGTEELIQAPDDMWSEIKFRITSKTDLEGIAIL